MTDSKQLKTARFAGTDVVSSAPTKLNAMEAAIRYIFGIEADTDFTSAVSAITGAGSDAEFTREIKATGGIKMTQSVSEFATDNDLGSTSSSDSKVPTQKAVKTYVDNAVGTSASTFIGHADTPTGFQKFSYLMSSEDEDGLEFGPKIRVVRAKELSTQTIGASTSANITWTISSTETDFCYDGPNPGDYSTSDTDTYQITPGTLFFVSATLKFHFSSAAATSVGLVAATINDSSSSYTGSPYYAADYREFVANASRASTDNFVINMSTMAVAPTNGGYITTTVYNNTNDSIYVDGSFVIVQFPIVGMGN